MQLHETGGDRARLYIPAKIRDEFQLSQESEMTIRILCDGNRPVAQLVPDGSKEKTGINRPVTIKSNGQAQIDFPRQIAEAMGLLGKEVELKIHDGEHIRIDLSESRKC
jgi:bifunctional DNA-binding transcriptional regulator/antitoxin component of YhaV-PrlF toxin-antitoxin module